MEKFDIYNIEDVLWSITDNCNLKCIYCAVSEEISYIPVIELTKAQIDHTIKELKKLKKLKSLIISGGEALLSKNLPYILSKCTDICTNIYLISNGTIFSSEIESITKNYNIKFMITIDSTNESINSLTRGSGSLKKSLSTLNILTTTMHFIVIISVITRYNIETIIDDLNFYIQKGVSRFLLQQLHCQGRASKDLYERLSPTPNQIGHLYENLLKFEREHPDVNLDYNEICFYHMRQAEYKKKCIPAQKYLPQRIFMCGAGYNFFALKANGDIIPCNALRSCKLGNIFTDELDYILQSSNEMSNILKLRSLRVNSIEGCRDCTYSPICDGGCRADVISLTGNILDKHPYCNIKNN